MNKKIQISFEPDSLMILESLTDQANKNFKNGSISYSDVINEAVRVFKIDVKSLQAKNINIKKSLRNMASQKDLDLDLAIKTLLELKNGTGRKQIKTAQTSEESR